MTIRLFPVFLPINMERDFMILLKKRYSDNNQKELINIIIIYFYN